MPERRVLGYDTRFGSGWVSGVGAVFLGGLGLGAVLCLIFPDVLTSAETRRHYPLPAVRFLIHLVLVGAFGLGLLSVVLSRRLRLGLTGVALATAAVLLGGSQVDVQVRGQATAIGLDWFLVNIFVLAMVFVPLETLFARLPEQSLFRDGWLTDLLHFAVSHVLVQVTVFLTLVPAAVLFHWAVDARLQAAVAAQPLLVQFVVIVVVADLAQYAIHRLFHRVPWLWRFHAVHHSSRAMDWLAASRIHLADAVVTRAFGFVPLYVLGFAPPAVYAYLVFVSFHAVFVHANVRFGFGRLAHVIGTPRFHHWHHAAEPQAVDRNFAIHVPALDRLFGTLYLPDRWPARYGLEGDPVPDHYLGQLAHPFATRR